MMKGAFARGTRGMRQGSIPEWGDGERDSLDRTSIDVSPSTDVVRAVPLQTTLGHGA